MKITVSLAFYAVIIIIPITNNTRTEISKYVYTRIYIYTHAQINSPIYLSKYKHPTLEQTQKKHERVGITS